MIYWLVFGMFLVTYIPRMLPMVLTKNLTFPTYIERWLSFIPYAALGALIFPKVLTVDPAHPWIGLVAALITFAVSWYTRQMIFSLLISILIVYFLQQWII